MSMLNTDDPETLRTYAALFEKMVPGDATCAAARALRFQADEIERRRSMNSEMVDAVANGQGLTVGSAGTQQYPLGS